MATQFIHRLIVLANANNGGYEGSNAQMLSNVAEQLFVGTPDDIGPDNVSIPLVAANGPDDGTIVAYMFDQYVKPIHSDTLANNGLNAPLPGLYWARIGRESGLLERRNGNDAPEAVPFTAADLLAEAGLKLRVVTQEI
jgi:hypothetical protein